MYIHMHRNGNEASGTMPHPSWTPGASSEGRAPAWMTGRWPRPLQNDGKAFRPHREGKYSKVCIYL